MIDWIEEVKKRKNDLLVDTMDLLNIESTYEEESIVLGAPFGKPIAEALSFMLHHGYQSGFETKNIDGYAGHITYGDGEEIVGVLGHLDVVPANEGWTSPPFQAEVRDGKLFARGAVDDKGPTMAVFYALKIIKELNLPLKRRVRLILGTDEERDWECVDHYFRHEQMPHVGFVPDASFPVIYAEKGIIDIELGYHLEAMNVESEALCMKEMRAGERLNMVPDQAEVYVEGHLANELIDRFENFLDQRKLKGKAELIDHHQVHLVVNGKAAHGSTPEKGENAGFYLATFLREQPLSKGDMLFLEKLINTIIDDPYGEKMAIAHSDSELGSVSVNAGVIEWCEGKGKLGLNIRYPNGIDGDRMIERIADHFREDGWQMDIHSHERPHYIDPKDPLVKTLASIYEQAQGNSDLLAIGGGTYARALKKGVAFGPVFPGRDDVAHQVDEYIHVDDLLAMTAIYAQAIYELANETQ
ncbi:dipeptidase PepV [Texcoconibacillus texcoconensis]|uniref:Succinyl-diaminopimelate desuccinylase n=1 Tax=Texcoconibacillus texcoconensis TaxID=1095777 RepID=A0A840QN89_9BACI|nr:dipeptidase PepV [Texcoconibacillus texcoconensis]MBB5172801.1 succinyl-diaminopimelate desuccinylase [Texcoconibacillus texcoconensis]